MGGSNPYIDEVKYTPATKKFKVTFLPSGKTIEVDPAQIPYGHNGLPGSILDFSEGLKAGLDHACGGVCACSKVPERRSEMLNPCVFLRIRKTHERRNPPRRRVRRGARH